MTHRSGFGTVASNFDPANKRTHVLATKKTSINFEKSLSELENLVSALESGDLSLEESLKTFEKGVQLTQACQEALTTAEQKVKILTEKNGEISEQEFNIPEED